MSRPTPKAFAALPVKVLDFGLPTLTAAATQMGVIINRHRATAREWRDVEIVSGVACSTSVPRA